MVRYLTRSTAHCEQDLADALLWPRTVENSTAAISCSQVGSQFRKETRATRRCLDTGVWAAADLTSCTLRADAEPQLVVWFVIEGLVDSDVPLGPGTGGFGVDGTPTRETRSALEAQV